MEIFDFTDFFNLYRKFPFRYFIQIGNVDFIISQFFGFCDPVFNLRNRPYFSTKTYFSCKAILLGNSNIFIGRQDRGLQRLNPVRIICFNTTGYIQEHVFRSKLEACAFLQYCQKHIQSFCIETSAASLWSTINSGTYQSLNFQ